MRCHAGQLLSHFFRVKTHIDVYCCCCVVWLVPSSLASLDVTVRCLYLPLTVAPVLLKRIDSVSQALHFTRVSEICSKWEHTVLFLCSLRSLLKSVAQDSLFVCAMCSMCQAHCLTNVVCPHSFYFCVFPLSVPHRLHSCCWCKLGLLSSVVSIVSRY